MSTTLPSNAPRVQAGPRIPDKARLTAVQMGSTRRSFIARSRAMFALQICRGIGPIVQLATHRDKGRGGSRDSVYNISAVYDSPWRTIYAERSISSTQTMPPLIPPPPSCTPHHARVSTVDYILQYEYCALIPLGLVDDESEGPAVRQPRYWHPVDRHLF